MSTYRTWKSIRAERVANGLVDEDRLAEVRERHNLTQKTLAERIGVSQSRISCLERGDVGRAGIPTIRDYVEALGGEVEIVAKFGDERIVIA